MKWYLSTRYDFVQEEKPAGWPVLIQQRIMYASSLPSFRSIFADEPPNELRTQPG